MGRHWATVALLVCACGSTSSSNLDAGDSDVDAPTDEDGGASTPRTITLTLTSRPMNAATFSFFVAYQDGSAPWTAAPPPTGDTYSFTVSAPSYGVAYGCIGNVLGTTVTQLRTVTTAHFAVGERTALTLDVPARCTDRGPTNVTLSGTVTNRPFGPLVVQFGTRSTFVSQTGGFSLQTPPGTADLVVTHLVSLGNNEYYVDRALAIRDVAVTGSTTRMINFATAPQAVSHPVTVNAPNARVVATTTLYTANGTTAGFVRESQDWETNSLAAVQRRATDVYDQSIAVTVPGAGVAVTTATNNPVAQTFVAPGLLGAVTSDVTSKTPYPILESTWPPYGNSVGYAWSATQQLGPQQCGGNLACTIAWSALLSPGVTGAQPGYRVPDLSQVTGFSPAYGLVGGAQVLGNVTAQTSSAGAGDFPPGIPANGTTRAFVRTDFAVTP